MKALVPALSLVVSLGLRFCTNGDNDKQNLGGNDESGCASGT